MSTRPNATRALPTTVINHAKLKHEYSSHGNNLGMTATQLREVGSQNLVSRLPIWLVRHASSSKRDVQTAKWSSGPCDVNLQKIKWLG